MIVTDPAKRAALAELYAKGFDPYIAAAGVRRWPEGDPRDDRQDFVSDSARYLRKHFHEVPVLVVPCAAGRLAENSDTFAQASFWGSVCPAVWSFMLALRERGLGSSWTTLHLPHERDAAELLGIPFDTVTQVGLFPVAYTLGTDFKVASRLPVADVIHWEQW